jgi:hypothetical protein
MGSRRLPRQRAPTASTRDRPTTPHAVRPPSPWSWVRRVSRILKCPVLPEILEPHQPPDTPAGGRFRSFRRRPYKARASGRVRTGSFRYGVNLCGEGGGPAAMTKHPTVPTSKAQAGVLPAALHQQPQCHNQPDPQCAREIIGDPASERHHNTRHTIDGPARNSIATSADGRPRCFAGRRIRVRGEGASGLASDAAERIDLCWNVDLVGVGSPQRHRDHARLY